MQAEGAHEINSKRAFETCAFVGYATINSTRYKNDSMTIKSKAH